MIILERLKAAADEAKTDLRIALMVNTEHGDVAIDGKDARKIVEGLEKYIDARLALFTALEAKDTTHADK